MSTADRLVAGLLSAIEQREKEHHRVAEELREAERTKMHVPNADYIRATAEDGLRLCRAHRKIIDSYRNSQDIVEAGVGSERSRGYLQALRDVIEALAEGYGLKTEENSDG